MRNCQNASEPKSTVQPTQKSLFGPRETVKILISRSFTRNAGFRQT